MPASRASFDDAEAQALLPTSAPADPEKPAPAAPAGARPGGRFRLVHVLGAFGIGLLLPLLGQHIPSFSSSSPAVVDAAASARPSAYGAPWAGSSVVEPFPPASPTNAHPELFSTHVGHAGPTPTGAEPGLAATAPALPVFTAFPGLVAPLDVPADKATGNGSDAWRIFEHWGNLSPYYSVPKGAFGIEAGAEAPPGCSITGLHLLHRHGARYPTGWASYGGPANLSSRLHSTTASWTAKGELSFLNGWTYKLGEEILTPFGRQQLYDLGVAVRMKYGFLLNNFTETNTLPVFRTESQDRMLKSAQNFAAGFFGIPYEGQYQQLVTIEDDGFNNTLAPYKTCPNAGDRAKADRGTVYVRQWAEIFLADARKRIQPMLEGYTLVAEDVYSMMQMCAYETVALGYSAFCPLFTREEWAGFDHALDLYFWYGSAFGSPVARVQGVGYLQELVARLTHTPIAKHNSSTNATLTDDERTFPLDHALYVDATHEVVVLNVLTALNLSTLAAGGPLPADHIPKDKSFVVSQLAPFGTNVQFQLLDCAGSGDNIRVIVNDGVVPLTGVDGCAADTYGRCALDKFVAGQRKMIADTDWDWGCHGNWTVPAGAEWETVVGYPPAPRAAA